MVIENTDCYLLAMVRGHYECPQLCQLAISLAEKWKPYRVLVEDASTGISLSQELKKFGTYVRPITVEHDMIAAVLMFKSTSSKPALCTFRRTFPS